MINELSLFSGYGGFTLGLRLAGLNVRTVAYVEWDKYPQEIIKARIGDGYLDDAPIFSDISSFRGEQFRGVVDIITAGFPCQPHSVAGLQRGATDTRNLWPDTLRVIREVEPRWVILENVPGLLSAPVDGGRPAYGGTVVGELAQVGYSVHWQTIGADDVGAPHRRKRWWCIGVADSIYDGLYRARGVATESGSYEPHHRLSERGDCATGERGLGDIPIWPPSPGDTDAWERVIRERPDLAPALSKEAESQFRRMDNGSSDRLDRPSANDRVNRLKALGNGIVPQSLAEFLRRVTNV